jgi:Lrp/AsnC family transcriptional regulator for asnA, asnC and gidA
MGHHQIDKLDEQILKMIAENARIPFLEVARACNVSGAAIHQRIQKLTNLGILKGSEYVIDPEKIGYETCAYIGLYLKDPEQFDSVTEALKKIPEVVECHFTTGQYDMFVKIYAKNNHHLLSIIHDKLQPLGLSRSETLISFNEAIKRQMPILNIADDDDEEDDIQPMLADTEETAKSEKAAKDKKGKGK